MRRLTGVGHPSALLAALIPADELQELMDKQQAGPVKQVGQHPLAPGA
jgi:hypothetical protein